MAADLSARARAAMRYFPPRSTDDVPTAPSLRPGVAMASVPILIVPSKHKASTALSFSRWITRYLLCALRERLRSGHWPLLLPVSGTEQWAHHLCFWVENTSSQHEPSRKDLPPYSTR